MIGVSISNLTEHPVEQISMFDNINTQKIKQMDKLLLDINEELGDDLLKFGIEL